MTAFRPMSHRIFILFWALSFFSQTLITALPLSNEKAEQSLKVRQGPASIASAIEGAVSDVMQAIELGLNIYDRVEKQEQGAAEQFTDGVVGKLAAQFPKKNIIIYHNAASQFSGVKAIHEHVEMNLHSLGRTRGYEIQIFDSGTFTLEGDGGVINWHFQGNFKRSGDFVQFFNIS